MKNPEIKNKRGFIALMSVILISAILMLIAVTLSTSSLYQRSAILDSELKERSLGNAEACADEALILIANEISHPATTTLNLTATDSCSIGTIPSSDNPRIFFVESNTSNFVTNIEISVNPTTLVVNYWEEVATN